MKIIKRDGKKVDFDSKKILNAIKKANESLTKKKEKISLEEIEDIVSEITEDYENQGKVKSVEFIQDEVEKHLIEINAYHVAKAYITYRYKRGLIRDNYKDFMEEVKSKLSGLNIENQNANVDEHSFGGRIGEATRILTKRFALENCVSEMARNNHINNQIYIHDLDSYASGMHNCLSIPFDDLLANGFNTRQTDVRPANSINTAFQLLAVIFQLQSLQQFGGVSATHLDWTMVPYVRKSFYKHFKDGMKYVEKVELYDFDNVEKMRIDDPQGFYIQFPEAYNYAMDMTEKELKQSVEGMFHNLNTLQSRSGNQLPFTSINFGTCTSFEGRLVIKALLDGSINGVGKFHKTPIFPCSIFQCMNGVNRHPGEPNYDLFKLALESTAKRLYPNYANVDWSGNEGYDKDNPKTYFSTMGCRTANGWDINGFGQLKDGRGNICPVTIILPELAKEAEEQVINNGDFVSVSNGIASADDEYIEELTKKEFFKILHEKIEEAKDMLIERFEYICNQSPESAKFMYENNTMAGYIPKEGIRSALKHGTLAIGQLGLAECLQILIGCDHTTEKGMKLAKDIEFTFKEKAAQYKEKYKLNFGVYFTPAETLCYTAMKKFKEKWGVIPNVSDHDYFTNSMHVPVWRKVNAFDKIDIESQLTWYSSAGCITYVELDSSVKNNIEALEKLVNYAMDKDIPYFAINTDNNICNDCGYQDSDLEDICPKCGSKNIQQLKRVTGYLTGNYKTAFNDGKIAEVEDRVKHTGVLVEE